MPRFALTRLQWPEFPALEGPPQLPASQFHSRIAALQRRIVDGGFQAAVVYGDREHFANLHYLTNFDPRFEEALLIVPVEGTPLLLVGNECQAYLPVSPLFREGALRFELYRLFSLEDQNRVVTRTLAEIFASEGVSGRVALIGTKTYGDVRLSDMPSYIVDTLRGVAECENRTSWMIACEDGLRTTYSAADIATFEQSNVKASDALRRAIFALRPGVTDRQLLAETIQYEGLPLSCHITCKTGPKRISLASAAGHTVEIGNTWSANIAYWGSNVCRAAWVARGPEDLPEAARDYVDAFGGPYFLAMVQWLEAIGVGAHCGAIHDRTLEMLPHETFRVELNPGHLIGYDEWPAAPFYPGSDVRLRSGMVLQSDVIPGNKTYFSSRMEDGYAIADEQLQAELAEAHPECWARMMARRKFLLEQLGIRLQPGVLPLSNIAGIIPPYGLDPGLVFTVSR